MASKLIIKHSNPVELYFTDLRHRPRQLPLEWDGGTCIVELPDEMPTAIHALLAVPGFGYTWATADNQGIGYAGGNVSLAHDTALSRIANCESRADTFGLKPNLQDAKKHLDAGNPMKALAVALVAGEEIEFRHAQILLQTRDRTSHPLPLISAPLFGERLGRWAIGVGPDWPGDQRPDFLRPAAQWDLVARLCNGTILPNFWRWIEYERGQYRWEPLDKIIEFSQRHEMKVKSFAIYWGGIGGTPPWFRNLNFDEKMQALENWTTDLVSRYRGRIAAWEIVNEMHDWGFANPSRLSHEQALNLTKFVSDLVGDLDPQIPRVINHCCIWGEYLQKGTSGGPWCPLTYLEDVKAAGIEFEGIGLQYYDPHRDLMECVQHLDRYLTFGKEIYITEMGTPSDPRGREETRTGRIDPYVGWRGPWTPERQAKWVEYWYTSAASRPQVKLLNWWDFDDERAFIPHAGLLDENGHPKPAYRNVHSLMFGEGARK